MKIFHIPDSPETKVDQLLGLGRDSIEIEANNIFIYLLKFYDRNIKHQIDMFQ